MQKFKYIELGDTQSQSSQGEDLFTKRSDEMKDYLKQNDLIDHSKLIFQDVNRQLFEVELKKDEEENFTKRLIYVRYLEQVTNFSELLASRSIKLQSISSKYISKYIKYDIVDDNNLPLIVQHIESDKQRQQFLEIFKGSIPIDKILKILKRLVKIVTYLHQQGISQLDFNERNFELDTQSNKPILIGIPLCAKANISEMEACQQDFQDLGELMIKIVISSNVTYANDLSFEQMRLKACVLQICQEFFQCRKVKNGVHELAVKQMSRLTRIKQICKSISQSVEQISVDSFIPQKKTQAEFHKQIEALEIDILGSIPEQYKENQSFEIKSCKDRWQNKIICFVSSLFFILLILAFWKSSQAPLDCVRKDELLYCKVNLEKEGYLFQNIHIDSSVKNLTIDFSQSFVKADRVINLLDKIQIVSLQYFMLDIQNNDISYEGLQSLFQYFLNMNGVFEIKLNLVNTTVDNKYFKIYQNNTKEAYQYMNDIAKEYVKIKSIMPYFYLNCNFSSYFNAVQYIQNSENTEMIGNYLYLRNLELQDDEFYYIFEEIYKKRNQSSYVDINLHENHINGSSLVKVMKNFINKNRNITDLFLKFSFNPIKIEHYQQLIFFISENSNLIFVEIELDLSSFTNKTEFLNLTFLKKKETNKLYQFNVKIVQSNIQNLLEISKYLMYSNILFGITARFNSFDELNQFQIDFPLNQEYCQSEIPQRAINSNLLIDKMEISTYLGTYNQIEANAKYNICKEQKYIENSLKTSLMVNIDDLYLEKSINIQNNNQQNKKFLIKAINQEFISTFQDDIIINFIQPKYQYSYQFKQLILKSYYVSDFVAENIVELIKNNKNLSEINLGAEFSIISTNAAKQLLSIHHSQPNIQQIQFNLNQNNLQNKNEYQQTINQTEIMNLVAESIDKSSNLKELFISDQKCNITDFNPILQAFNNSNQLYNLTIEFDTQYTTEQDIRSFYYKARSFKDEGKNLQIPRLISSQSGTQLYSIQTFYKQILFQMRQNENELQLFLVDDLSQQMMNDLTSEIKNFRVNQFILSVQNQMNSQDIFNICKEFAENQNLKHFFFYAKELKSSVVNTLMQILSKSKTFTFLSIKVETTIQEIDKQIFLEKSMIKIINEMNSLQTVIFQCKNCLENEKSFQNVMEAAYQSQNLQKFSLYDGKLIISEKTYKRFALIEELTEKNRFYHFSEDTQNEQLFKDFLQSFKNIDKEFLSLQYSNSEMDGILQLYLNNYIQKYQSKLKNVSLEFTNDNLTDNNLKILSKAIQNLKYLQESKINFQDNKISDQGCNDFVNSLIASQDHIKIFNFNIKENNLVEFRCFNSILILIQNMNEIEEINLSLPNIDQSSFFELLNSLQSKKKLHSITIDIDNLLIQMNEAKQIGSKFGQILPIKNLIIRGEYEKLIQSYFSFEKLKESNNAEINLDFSNTFQYYESMEDIFKQLDEANLKPYKLKVNFSSNDLQDDSVSLINSYVKKNVEQIIELNIDLSNNPIYDESCEELSKTIHNPINLIKYTLNVVSTSITFQCLESIHYLKTYSTNLNYVTIKLSSKDSEYQQKAEQLFSNQTGVQLIFISN